MAAGKPLPCIWRVSYTRHLCFTVLYKSLAVFYSKFLQALGV